ncbi:hypothetical protein ACFPTO_00060 [Paraburkholderia denitrificans]|uniref:Uncharacterized protein n=1 Tax=Paraburkholderia denitrificans TaxID=694025 RepID=A0ABW0J2F5_9BURK
MDTQQLPQQLTTKAKFQETFIDAISLARAATALAIMDVGENKDSGLIWASEVKWQTVIDHLLRQGQLPLIAYHYDGETGRFEPTTELQGAWVATEELRHIFANPPREAIEEFEQKRRDEAEKMAKQEADRRAAGRYRLREAAEEIARNTGERFGPMLEKLKAAVSAGALVVYEPGRIARYNPKTVRDLYEEARAADLNAWLAKNEPLITFRFPEPSNAPAGSAESATAPGETPEQRQKRRLARFRKLGGDLERAGGDQWRLTGMRGALAALSREEKVAGRARHDVRDVKRELVKAAESDMRDQNGS